MKPLTTISYGGGVQSTALIVLAATGRLPKPDAALFANVGDDSEHPATLDYVRDIAVPYAAEHGIPVHELHRQRRDGTSETLMQRLTREGSRSIDIPVRMASGAPGNRSCTGDFKIAVVGKWLKANGASRDNKATVWIGISVDEIHRASNKRAMPYETPAYPLLDLGLDRSACMTVIKNAGLPVPPKSSCYFCPFHRPQTWAEMRRDEPELFNKSADLEDLLNRRRDMLGKDHVWLTGFNKPLRDAIGVAQDMLPIFPSGPDIDTCDEGYCWT
jgi:hypothetical protein